MLIRRRTVHRTALRIFKASSLHVLNSNAFFRPQAIMLHAVMSLFELSVSQVRIGRLRYTQLNQPSLRLAVLRDMNKLRCNPFCSSVLRLSRNHLVQYTTVRSSINALRIGHSKLSLATRVRTYPSTSLSCGSLLSPICSLRRVSSPSPPLLSPVLPMLLPMRRPGIGIRLVTSWLGAGICAAPLQRAPRRMVLVVSDLMLTLSVSFVLSNTLLHVLISPRRWCHCPDRRCLRPRW